MPATSLSLGPPEAGPEGAGMTSFSSRPRLSVAPENQKGASIETPQRATDNERPRGHPPLGAPSDYENKAEKSAHFRSNCGRNVQARSKRVKRRTAATGHRRARR